MVKNELRSCKKSERKDVPDKTKSHSSKAVKKMHNNVLTCFVVETPTKTLPNRRNFANSSGTTSETPFTKRYRRLQSSNSAIRTAGTM